MLPTKTHLLSITLSVLTISFFTACQSLRSADEQNSNKATNVLPESCPWDISALSKAPSFEWIDRTSNVHSLQYKGEPFKGADTRVFAYYASPNTLNNVAESDNKFPAVVLAHGGGGMAFKEWAQLWAERGYAAIAMDLAGNGPDKIRLPNGGPDQSDDYKFGKIDEPISDQWTYHAVANVMLAHSLIRTFPEVDSNNIGVTGISWGGYLTCIVAGLDHRFKAAVPVYGCGFLNEHSAWLQRFAQMSPEQAEKWFQLWDPSRYVGYASMPVFFMNGTNDFAYWLESYAKTYKLVRGERNLRITVNMPHSHPDGWSPVEIGLFMDQHLKGAEALPKVGKVTVMDNEILAQVNSARPPAMVSIHYTSDLSPSPDRKWISLNATFADCTIHAPSLPDEAIIAFITLTDARNITVSSELIFLTQN